ncbi:hypothetical protein PM082_022549 [Marasmius tenuissimus]|nr:hypothetical protein PM082_022549 [Marasmius tenuissimus]
MLNALRSLYNYVFDRGHEEDKPRRQSPQFQSQRIGGADPICPPAPSHFSPLPSPEFLHPNPQLQPGRFHLQPQDALPPQQDATVVTENRGNYNQTNNGSNVYSDCGTAIFYLQFPNGSSSAQQATPVPPSTSTTTASPTSVTTASPSPENNTSANSIPAALLSSRADPSTIHGDDQTPGQLYASLLSTCRLGYPLWKPSPRRTAAGKEYLINIGDVGVCSDLDPFHTLFNITHGDQVPEDADPLCDVEKDITVDAEYHGGLEILAKPKGAILEQRGESSVFTFELSEKEGALLMLPRGGVLKKLQNTHRFKTRIQSHWRQWYDFAEKAGDLDESQTLCLLTGIERCSTWAMAGWDAKSSRSHNKTDFLKLTVDNVSGRCLWSFRPAGCWAQSARTPTPIHKEPEETVFIRGIWINRMNGSTNTSPSPPPCPSSNDGEDPGASRHSGSPSNRSQSAPHPSRNPQNSSRSFSDTSSSTQESPSDCDHAMHFEGCPSPSDEHQPHEGNTINLSGSAFNTVSHPCHLINKFALELISQIRPPLLDPDCVAFSQDEDWMGVLDSFDEEVPSGTELLRRICGKLKFVVEGGVIYTETMTTAEIERIRQSMSPVTGSRNGGSAVVPVLLQLCEPSGPHTEEEFPEMEISYTESRSSMQDLPASSMDTPVDHSKFSPEHLHSTDNIRAEDPVPSTELGYIWNISDSGYINDCIPDYSAGSSEFMDDPNSPSTTNYPSLEASLFLPRHLTSSRPQSVLSGSDLSATAVESPSISSCGSFPPGFPRPYDPNPFSTAPPFTSFMETPVDKSNGHVTGLVDDLTYDSSDKEGSGFHASKDSPSLAPLKFFDTSHNFDPPRVLDGDPSPDPLDCRVGPSRPVRRRYERPSPYIAPSEGAILSPTVAKPTVLEASSTRRKKEGKYSCHLCSATFTERHGVTSTRFVLILSLVTDLSLLQTISTLIMASSLTSVPGVAKGLEQRILGIVMPRRAVVPSSRPQK